MRIGSSGPAGRVRLAAVLAAVLAVVAGLLTAGVLGAPLASADGTVAYVALGDSSASGPNIPNQVDVTCGRSDHNWPTFLAQRLNTAPPTDVTCSGATTSDLFQQNAQHPSVDPQLNALQRDTGLVTLAIGANDLGLGYAFTYCQNVPDVATCQANVAPFTTQPYDAGVERVRPSIRSTLQEIRTKSPHAEVVVVGYLTYWQPGGCYSASDPFTPAVADYLQASFDSLMAMLRSEANGQGMTYADIRGPSAGNGMCEPADQRWVEDGNPVNAFPYHPNATGMEHAAEIIAGSVHLG